jgi:predicted nicotinamide N-methyase
MRARGGVQGAGASPRSGMVRRAPGVPHLVSGFPTETVRYDFGSIAVDLVAVHDLESRLDRQRLIADPDFEPPYWALLWSGSRILAHHVVQTLDVRGKSVLDAGCGLGLVGVTAARCGAGVTAIDRAREAAGFVRASARLNGCSVDVLVGDLLARPLSTRFDLILAAELLYDVPGFDRLAEALTALLAPEGSLWMADARRVDTTSFYAALARRGLTIGDEGEVDAREEGSLVRVQVREITRPGARAARA